jgi:AcrR family transcriptional regulator
VPRQYEDTETRRRQVADAALMAIAEDGVAGFTTRAVAARVGISDGTLFRHFGNKQEIVLEAMGRLQAELDDSLVDSGDALVDLEAMFRHRAAFVGAEGSVGRLIFSDELVHLAGPAGRERVDAWRARSVGFLVDRLRRLVAEGRVRTDVDVPAISVLVQGALLTFAMQASLGRSGSPAALQARIDHVWRALHTLLFAHPDER